MLTVKEEQVKQYLYEKFIPTLNNIFEEKNPVMYYRWGKNCCRQTAVFGAALLNEMLPEYKWEVWDGFFDDVVHGKLVRYNHAWIYGKHKTENKGIFADLSRLHHERLFFSTINNKYPKNHSDYINMKELQRMKLNWKKLLREEIEYYTSTPSEKLLEEVKFKMDFSKKHFTNLA